LYTSSTHKRIALDALRGRWGMSILVTLVASFLGASAGNLSMTYVGDIISGKNDGALFTGGGSIWPFFIALYAFVFVLALAAFIIGGAMEIGLSRYNIILLTDARPVPFSIIFSAFNIFGKALGVRLLIYLLPAVVLYAPALLTLLLPYHIRALSAVFFIAAFVFHIYISFGLVMTPYIMAYDGRIGVMDSIRQSWHMMRGHRVEFFVLNLSFIGWALLAALTAGIGLLWLIPYMNAATASFYLNLKRQYDFSSAHYAQDVQ
jgi:uncharacterized membrane protein